MVNLTLYKNNSENNKVGKSLTPIISIAGTIKDNCSITNPTIEIKSNSYVNANYCYIAEFDRYYFIDDITITNNTLYQLTLKVDVLESFKNQIKANNCILERQEFLYNLYLKDNLMNVSTDTFTLYKSFPRNCFNAGEFVVMTVG